MRERKPKGSAKNGSADAPPRGPRKKEAAVDSEWVWLLLPFLAVAVVVVVNGARAGSIALPALPGFLGGDGGDSVYQGDRGFGDLYELLGVERDADNKAIKKVRALAHQRPLCGRGFHRAARCSLARLAYYRPCCGPRSSRRLVPSRPVLIGLSHRTP